MCFLDAQLRQGETAVAERLANEYWTPKFGWQFWEFLSPEMVVVAIADGPDLSARSIAALTYDGDRSRVTNCLKAT